MVQFDPRGQAGLNITDLKGPRAPLFALTALFITIGCVTEPIPGPTVPDDSSPRAATKSLESKEIRIARIQERLLAAGFRWVPNESTLTGLRVIPARPAETTESGPVLPPSPSGYFIVGCQGQVRPAEEVVEFVEAWSPGTSLSFIIAESDRPEAATNQFWIEATLPPSFRSENREAP